jgi:metal-sulfur cluster biosynthetic enzyme
VTEFAPSFGTSSDRGPGLRRGDGDALIATIEAALSSVTEPCSISFGKPISIVEMGLIERIDVCGDHAEITLCLTDAACIHFAGMQRFIRDELLALPEINTVEVKQTLDQLWTPDRRRAA